MKNCNSYWRLGSSSIALAVASTLGAGAATAQTVEAAQQPRAASVDEVVVTGTSIRGSAPVGSPLTVVDRAEIDKSSAQTLQQVMKTIPALSNSAANSQGSLVGSSYYAPTIHSLGSSASSSTLVLIDGHRIPLGNTSHPLPDPSIIPAIALERVEVVADGASSIYGSDAVAGVINFVTRKGYDGLMVTGQGGVGDSYHTYNANLLWGSDWNDGSAMFAYGYSKRGALGDDSRDFLHPNHLDEGGTNFQNFNCWPATIQPAGTSSIYLTPTTATPVSNSSVNAPCNNNAYSDHIGEETRHNVMASITKDFGDRARANVDLVYSYRDVLARTSRGNITATVFRDGPQANPFYVNPPGVMPGTTAGDRQTVRFSADELLGPGAYNDNRSETYYASGDIEYDLSSNWTITLFGLYGKDDTTSLSEGQICGSCANLALNGTTNSSGNPATISVPGTNIIVTQFPLTVDNALDVWNVGSANQTSPEVLADLIDNSNFLRARQSLAQGRLHINGTLFDLPGGEVKVALGAEVVRYTLNADVVRPNNTGPVSSGSTSRNFPTDRLVKSVFGEVLVPVVGPDNELPFVQALDLNVSVRYDSYAVFGGTTNPKFGVNWEVVDGLKLRGSIATSFVAPPLTSFGARGTGLYAGSSYTTYNGQINVPYDAYPEAALLPGCDPMADRCIIGTGAVQGINILSGNQELVPQTGDSWTIGADIAPNAIPLRLSVTLFDNKFRGGVTSPNAGIAVNTRALNHLLTIYPTGATPAQIAAEVGPVPQGGNLPGTVYFIYNFLQRNVVNINVRGLDMQARYDIDTDMGQFSVGGSATYFLKFDQFIGEDGEVFSPLGTAGYNQTFSSLRAQARGNIGWTGGRFGADLFANYSSGYRNWSSSSVEPITQTPAGNPLGGGDRVGATVTFDAHLSYDLPPGILGETQIFVDGTNIFDRDPPFYNAADGYGPYAANPIGRVITVGVRAKW